MGDKMKKFIVLFLALLTVLAFSPFIFSNPNSHEPSTPIDENSTSTNSMATSTEN